MALSPTLRFLVSPVLAVAVLMPSVHAYAAQTLEPGQIYRETTDWLETRSQSPATLDFDVPRVDGDLLLHIQSYNVSNRQVSILLNGERLGTLDPARTEDAYSPIALWVLPAKLLTKKNNRLRLNNRSDGSAWGIRHIAVYDPRGQAAVFGKMDHSQFDSLHPRSVRVNIPPQNEAKTLVARFFNAAEADEVAIVLNDRRYSTSDVGRANAWGNPSEIPLEPGAANTVRFVHLENRDAETPVTRWAVRLPTLRGQPAVDDSDDNGPNQPQTPDTPQTDSDVLPLAGLTTVNDSVWSETAVRKVLHTFAYGGHASHVQIRKWANMPARHAIGEMLTMQQHNLLLSPEHSGDNDGTSARAGTLRAMADYLASPASGVPENQKHNYGQRRGALPWSWTMSTLLRGYNPFRQRVGFWETNYHLAVNKEAGVTGEQLATYYDTIMAGYQNGRPYQKILSAASKSAAVATQYRHYRNEWRGDWCRCNEDFAREFYQLFFGIVGVDDPEYHESVTIKNMSHALTDMNIVWNANGDGTNSPVNQVTFGTELHYPLALEMLGTQIDGQVASQRIDAIADVAINHPESKASLPVMVVEGLADDNLSESDKASLRTAWQSMPNKDMLRFIQNYAISTLFHDPSRKKRWSTVERNMIVISRMVHNNREAYTNMYSPISKFLREDVDIFSPRHNVFGAQTGVEAASSPGIFRQNYNESTDQFQIFNRTEASLDGNVVRKNWGSVIPLSSDGTHRVKDVAEYLWEYFLADGLKNFGPVARAQVYSLLEGSVHLQYRLNPNDHQFVLTTNAVQNDPAISGAVTQLANTSLALRSSDSDARQLANRHVGSAVNFIVATPYAFAQEGR